MLLLSLLNSLKHIKSKWTTEASKKTRQIDKLFSELQGIIQPKKRVECFSKRVFCATKTLSRRFSDIAMNVGPLSEDISDDKKERSYKEQERVLA
jgi:DNA-binding HxlR family transcriptional regulator